MTQLEKLMQETHEKLRQLGITEFLFVAEDPDQNSMLVRIEGPTAWRVGAAEIIRRKEMDEFALNDIENEQN